LGVRLLVILSYNLALDCPSPRALAAVNSILIGCSTLIKSAICATTVVNIFIAAAPANPVMRNLPSTSKFTLNCSEPSTSLKVVVTFFVTPSISIENS